MFGIPEISGYSFFLWTKFKHLSHNRLLIFLILKSKKKTRFSKVKQILISPVRKFHDNLTTTIFPFKVALSLLLLFSPLFFFLLPLLIDFEMTSLKLFCHNMTQTAPLLFFSKLVAQVKVSLIVFKVSPLKQRSNI